MQDSYQDIYNEVMSNLKQRYEKQTLTIQETANELSMSLSSFRNAVDKGQNIPEFRQVGIGKERITRVFPINCIARFLATSKKTLNQEE